MDIFQYLEEVQEDAFSLAVEQIEAKYYDICCMLASTEYAERIKAIDLESYKESIRVGLDAAVEMATNEEAKAIYFEYDLDNEWNSQFYPALTGSKTPPQNSAKAKKLRGKSTARKSPIGSTNNQWG